MTSPSSPNSGQNPARQERAALLALLLLVSVGVLTGLLIAIAARRVPAAARVPFDPSPLKSIERQRPDVVIIGNSMLYTRLAETLLDDLVKPTTTKIISRGGTQSAVWYAQFKYYVVASRAKAKRVVVFFRDRELTLGRARTSGQFGANLERTTPRHDPVIDRILATRPEVPLDHLRVGLERLAPVGRLREFASSAIDKLALKLAGLSARRRSLNVDKKAINRVFEVENLRADDAEGMSSWTDQSSFQEGLERSFLPEFVKLAQENHVALTFVRVRPRRVAAGRPESPELSAYVSDLRRYLQRHRVGFVDQSNASWEALELYGNGDHIAPRYRAVYTRLFVKHHPELFKLP